MAYSDDGDEYHPTPAQGTTRGRSTDEEAGARSTGEQMDEEDEDQVNKKASTNNSNKQPQAKRLKNSVIVSVIQ